ncbi:nuclear mRNA export, poly(A)+RNA binding protein [Rhizina undulata]
MNSTALRPSRGPSRGGIAKRSGPTRTPRVDDDGDLDMDAPISGGRTRGRGGRNPTRSDNKPSAPRNGMNTKVTTGPAANKSGNSGPGQRFPRPTGNTKGRTSTAGPSSGTRSGSRTGPATGALVEARVYGWKDSKGSAEECVKFLERKSRLKFKKTHKQGDAIHILVHFSELPVLLEWDNVQFASAHLKITSRNMPDLSASIPPPVSAPRSQDAIDTIKTLEQVLANRYNAEAKFLDLSRLGQDPLLRQTGFFSLSSTTSKMFPAMMHVANKRFDNASSKRMAVQSVSLAYNELKDVSMVTSLSLTFPDLKNLSLEGNRIENWKALEGWRHRFKFIEEIVMTGNPITQLPGYKEEAVKRWPYLVLLDYAKTGKKALTIKVPDEDRPLVKIPPVTPVDGNGNPINPVAIQGHAVADPEGMVSRFLSDFYRLYDNNRVELVSKWYDPKAEFSISVNTSAPRSNLQQTARQHWDAYIPRSRNLLRVNFNTQTCMDRLAVGSKAIGNLMAELPMVKHNISDLSLWSIDSQVITQKCMMISIHGEYEEGTDGNPIKRSFDRSFAVKPVDGNLKITNDILIVRAYGGNEAYQPNVGVTLPVPEAGLPILPVASPVAVEPQVQQVQQAPAFLTADRPKNAQELERVLMNPPPFPPEHVAQVPVLGVLFTPEYQQMLHALMPPYEAPSFVNGKMAFTGKDPIAIQTAKIMELCKRTALTQEYSQMCLAVNDWDFEDSFFSYLDALAASATPGYAYMDVRSMPVKMM